MTIHGLQVNTSLSSKPTGDNRDSCSFHCIACESAEVASFTTPQQEWMRGSLPLLAITAAASSATFVAVLAGWSPADAATAVRMALQHELQSQAQGPAPACADATQQWYGTELPPPASSPSGGDGVASGDDPRESACTGGSSSEIFSRMGCEKSQLAEPAIRDQPAETSRRGVEPSLSAELRFLELFEPVQLQMTLLEANMQTIRADMIENSRANSEDVQSAEARLHTAAWNLETRFWDQLESIERKAALVESDVQSMREQLVENSHSAAEASQSATLRLGDAAMKLEIPLSDHVEPFL